MEFIFNTGKNVKAQMKLGPAVIPAPPSPSDPTVVHSPDESIANAYALTQAQYDALSQSGEIEENSLYFIVEEG